MEEPEIPQELLKHKTKPKAKSPEVINKTVEEPAKADIAAAENTDDAGKVTEKTINIESLKIRDAVSLSSAAASAAAKAVEVEERTKEMSAVIPKETPEEKRRREAAEAALKEKSTSESAKAKNKKRSAKNAEKSAAKELAGRKYAVANIVACCAIFFGIGVFLIVCKRESGFIQSENRNLAEKPTLSIATILDGSYFEDITKWYTDTIPGREQLKPFSSGFEQRKDNRRPYSGKERNS